MSRASLRDHDMATAVWRLSVFGGINNLEMISRMWEDVRRLYANKPFPIGTRVFVELGLCRRLWDPGICAGYEGKTISRIFEEFLHRN